MRFGSRLKCGRPQALIGEIFASAPPAAGTQSISYPGANRSSVRDARGPFTTTILAPSGDQTGVSKKAESLVSGTGRLLPSARILFTVPPLSDQVTYASHWPSGDQAGTCSLTDSFVRRRGVPFGRSIT